MARFSMQLWARSLGLWVGRIYNPLREWFRGVIKCLSLQLNPLLGGCCLPYFYLSVLSSMIFPIYTIPHIGTIGGQL